MFLLCPTCPRYVTHAQVGQCAPPVYMLYCAQRTRVTIILGNLCANNFISIYLIAGLLFVNNGLRVLSSMMV